MTDSILSEDHIRAIGELVVNMTRLESLLVDHLAIFLQTDIVSTMLVFAPHQFSSKVSTLKALLSLGLTKEQAKQDDLVGRFQRAGDLADFRNTVVHAYWTIDADGNAVAVRYQSRGYFTRSRTPISATEIHDKAAEARALEEELRGLRDHLHKECPPPSPYMKED